MRRLLVLIAVAGTVALAAPAEAKPFSYSDAKGDMPANAGLDIVSVGYATTGDYTTSKVGRKTVRKYQPTKLLVTMKLAGAPVEQPGVKYRAEAQVDGCGTFTFTYAPGTGAGLTPPAGLAVGCGGAGGTTGGDTLFLDPKIETKGSSLVWTISLKSLPKNARAGALLFGFRASVDVTEPVLGTLGPDDVGDGVLDKASSDADWEIS